MKLPKSEARKASSGVSGYSRHLATSPVDLLGVHAVQFGKLLLLARHFEIVGHCTTVGCSPTRNTALNLFFTREHLGLFPAIHL